MAGKSSRKSAKVGKTAAARRVAARAARPRKVVAGPSVRKPMKPAAKGQPAGTTPKLLSGGNPQIAKGDGDVPVQAYIAAMPGWKRDVGRRLDALVVRTVPDVRKAVRWNTPFYGIEDRGWFLGFHCITKYVKVAFFRGTSLRPVPPVASKQKGVRYFHIHEDDHARRGARGELDPAGSGAARRSLLLTRLRSRNSEPLFTVSGRNHRRMRNS